MHFGQTRKNVPLSSVFGTAYGETSSAEKRKVSLMPASLSINHRWPYKLSLTDPYSTTAIMLCMSQRLGYRSFIHSFTVHLEGI